MTQADLDLLYIGHSSDLEYLTGAEKPHSAYGPARYFAHWAMGALVRPEGTPLVLVPRHLSEFAVKVDYGELHVIREEDDPRQVVAGALKRNGTRPPKRIGLNVDAFAELALNLQTMLPSAEVSVVADLLGGLRAVKSAEELEAVRQACMLTEGVYNELLEIVGTLESTPAASRWLSRRMREVGATDQSFEPSIMAVDDRGQIVREFPKRGCLRIDFGAALNGYCCDFGRTVSLGEPSEDFASAYELVLKAQRAGYEALKPGVPAKDIDRITRDVIDAAGFGEYFRHRTGHAIGMDVNEPPYLESVDPTPIAAGMAFTVEPGITIPGKFTVFTEDIFVVTEKGGERLNEVSSALRVI
jgi:Xaa-Pro aminopeptidase